MTKFSRDKLVALRTAAGVKQWEIADSLGIKQKNYYEKEKKGQAITCEQLAVIADCLDVDISEFFENTKAQQQGGGPSTRKGGDMNQLEVFDRIIAELGKHISRLEEELRELRGGPGNLQTTKSKKEGAG